MNRRTFLCGLALGRLSAPLAAEGQQPTQVFRFVASLARPGGNIAGVFLDRPELNGKLLELRKEAIPGIARVAVLRDSALNQAPVRAAEVAARSLGLQLQIVEARGPSNFEDAF